MSSKKFFALRALSFWMACVCFGSLAFAWYLQTYQGIEPCPLCALQRFVFFVLGVLLLMGVLLAPKRLIRRVYYSVCALVSFSGVVIAIRHVWLQHLPANEVPACGANIQILLENLPLFDALKKVFQGSGECAKVHWHFLTLTIPEWSLILFAGLSLVLVYQVVRAQD